MAVATAWARHLGQETAVIFHRQHALGDPDEVHGLLAAAGYREIEAQTALGMMRFPTAVRLVRGYAAMSGLQVAHGVAEALMRDVTEALARRAWSTRSKRCWRGHANNLTSTEGTMSDYAHPESLVNTQWVAEHLADPAVCFVEIIWGDSGEWGTVAYRGGHIPGAVAWDFATELQDPGRNDIVDQAGFGALLSRSGVAPTTTVVVYSGLSNLLATFAFWLLKVYRHQDVRLLDGGRDKWLAEGRPLTSELTVIERAHYRSQPPAGCLRARRENVLQAIGQPGHLLVDARSAEMFSGADKAGASRGGHIPGAINLAARRETNPDGSFLAWRVPTVHTDGTFKPAAELRALFSSLGITPERAIIIYCVRGGLSTHAWFVLTQLLGYPDVCEYDRSWVEWGNAAELPIEGG